MATLRVFVTNSLRGAALDLIAQFTRETGIGVEAVYEPAKTILGRVAAGERADLALLGSGSIEELVGSGILDPSTVRPIAQSGVGVGVKTGTPHPNVRSAERFVAALRAAESIAHTTEGASGMYFGRLLSELGLADALRPKLRTQPGGLIGEVLVAGRAQLGIQQISELRAVPGVDVVGPLPAPYQRMFPNAGALFAAPARPDEARALLDRFRGAAAARRFAQHGLEPLL